MGIRQSRLSRAIRRSIVWAALSHILFAAAPAILVSHFLRENDARGVAAATVLWLMALCFLEWFRRAPHQDRKDPKIAEGLLGTQTKTLQAVTNQSLSAYGEQLLGSRADQFPEPVSFEPVLVSIKERIGAQLCDLYFAEKDDPEVTITFAQFSSHHSFSSYEYEGDSTPTLSSDFGVLRETTMFAALEWNRSLIIPDIAAHIHNPRKRAKADDRVIPYLQASDPDRDNGTLVCFPFALNRPFINGTAGLVISIKHRRPKSVSEKMKRKMKNFLDMFHNEFILIALHTYLCLEYKQRQQNLQQSGAINRRPSR